MVSLSANMNVADPSPAVIKSSRVGEALHSYGTSSPFRVRAISKKSGALNGIERRVTALALDVRYAMRFELEAPSEERVRNEPGKENGISLRS